MDVASGASGGARSDSRGWATCEEVPFLIRLTYQTPTGSPSSPVHFWRGLKVPLC